MKQLYVGKAKALYETENPEEYLVVYSNQATAFNGEKKEQIEGKGVLNNQISALIFDYLNQKNVRTQFIRKVSDNEQLVKKLTMLPVEVVVRNIVAGSFAKKFGMEEGATLTKPTVELFYKDDALGDPFVNVSQLEALNIMTEADCQTISQLALDINQHLMALFDNIDITLVDMKFEFGRLSSGEIILGDEISPDTCRLWDKATHKKLDKDNFRRGLGSIIPVYEEVYARLLEVIK